MVDLSIHLPFHKITKSLMTLKDLLQPVKIVINHLSILQEFSGKNWLDKST